MKFIQKMAAAGAIALLSTSSAVAQNPLPAAGDKLVKFGDVDGWTVYANKTRGDCLIVSSFETGAVQMGVTEEDRELGYLGIFTKLDIGVIDGRKSEIVISLDGKLYEGVSTGLSGHIKGGYSGGYILTDNPEFKRDIAKKHKMVVFPDTAGAFIVDLTGTYKAMEMARKCFNT